MTPRRRSKAKTHFPDNVYERKGYYSWRHPISREEFGLGRNKAAAFAQAVEANLHLAKLRQQPRLIHRLTGDGERTVEAWNTKYQTLLSQKNYASVTLRQYKSLGKRMVHMLKPATPLAMVTPLEISGLLDAVAITEGKARLAQALRSFMRDSFREARVQGWYVNDNPVMDTKLSVDVEVKRARFTFDTFVRVYAHAKLTWLVNAIDLALVSGQRREDVSEAQFSHFRDGFWWLEQQSEKSSTPHRIKIPLDLRLDCFGKSVGDVVAQCRRTGVLSKYLIHQTVNRGNSPRGRQIWIDTLSKGFANAVKASGVDWGDKDPPTFHELRSLAERLYADQGIDPTELTGIRKTDERQSKWVAVDGASVNTQHLLGHNHPDTTAIYHDSRGAEWTPINLKRPPK